MKRREFILTSSALLLAGKAFAEEGFITYSEGVVQNLLGQGKIVLIDYSTEWCSTCAAMKRSLAQLRGENPQYDAEITFVHVDYDAFGSHDITNRYNVPRRSTFVLAKGGETLGTLVANPSAAAIQALLDQGLAAATS